MFFSLALSAQSGGARLSTGAIPDGVYVHPAPQARAVDYELRAEQHKLSILR